MLKRKRGTLLFYVLWGLVIICEILHLIRTLKDYQFLDFAFLILVRLIMYNGLLIFVDKLILNRLLKLN
jgi:hypothetical protein